MEYPKNNEYNTYHAETIRQLDDETSQVLEQLSQVLDRDEDEGSLDECSYDRAITLHLPAEAAAIYGITYVSAPARDFLKWIGQELPDEAERMNKLRADFYAGDRDEDYSYEIDSGPMAPSTFEERAEIRVSLERSAARRAECRAQLEAEYAESCELEDAAAANGHPFGAEEAESEAKRKNLSQRWKALEDDWDSFVRERETWGPERERKEATRRAALLAKEEALKAEDYKNSDRHLKLIDKISAWREAARRSAEEPENDEDSQAT